MLKKSVFAFALLCSTSLLAQPQKYDAAKVGQAAEIVSNAVIDTAPAVAKAIPEVSRSLQDAMLAMIKSIAPAIISLEENKKLPPATDAMGQEIIKTLPASFAENAKIDINEDMNELNVSGSKDSETGSIKYKITRNLAMTITTQNVINKKSLIETPAPEEENYGNSLINLDGESLDVKDFSLKSIDSKPFFAYFNEDKEEVFLVGNVGSYINIRIQSQGDDYIKLTREFVEGLNYAALKTAVQDDNKPLNEIITEIDKKLNDPKVLEKLSEDQVE